MITIQLLAFSIAHKRKISQVDLPSTPTSRRLLSSYPSTFQRLRPEAKLHSRPQRESFGVNSTTTTQNKESQNIQQQVFAGGHPPNY